MKDLIERLQLARAGSRVLDAEIARAVGERVGLFYTTREADAATLVPHTMKWTRANTDAYACVWVPPPGASQGVQHGQFWDSINETATPILALVICGLKAGSAKP